MSWSTVNFGEHSGKTLPQIVFVDPDWFFWAVEKGDVFRGSLIHEAGIIDARARAIRIPNNSAENLLAEYVLHSPSGKFSHMQIVPASQPKHEGSSPTFRRDRIDLSVPHRIAQYDKLGNRNLLSSAKDVLFGSKSARMTKERCGAFFDDPSNFIL
jgi:hypothetical protein